MSDRHDDGRELDLRPGDRAGTVVVAASRTGRVGSFFRGLLMGVLALVGLAFLASQVVDLDLNPFDEQRTDRSQPPLLESIQDLSRHVPDFLLNQRTLFVASGSVQSYVDFGALADGAVVTSGPDDRSVAITLPRPRLDGATLDLEDSYVFAEERGLLNRLGEVFTDDSDRQQEVYQLAADRLDRAAVETELVERAEDNTRQMLTGLLGSLGYTDVSVDFDADATT